MSDQSFLSWPFFEDHHRNLSAELSQWAAATVPDLIDHHDTDGSCRRLVRALGEAGWLRVAVPASHGGLYPNFDVRALCLVRETLAYVSGLADFAFAMQGLGTGPISLFGSDELK
ncbi:MAG: acyl-CoA dehydrogenase family protein, partial [Tardiphaga sp.]